MQGEAKLSSMKTDSKTEYNPLDDQVGGSHYKNMVIQPVVFIERNKLSFLEGSVVKRICRYRHGGKGLEDLQKIKHEIDLLIELHTKG